MNKSKIFLLTLALAIATTSVFSQTPVDPKHGKGLYNVIAKDSSWTMKFGTRIQVRYDNNSVLGDSVTTADRAYIRRARLKFDGWAISPKIGYKIEYDVVNGFVLDALLKFEVAKGLKLWFGQTKLPGNRERVISSQNMEFVDRSLLNGKYTLDRDAGFQIRHEWKAGKMVIREALAWSQGEGLNVKDWNTDGHDYTARVELLPMGKFAGKGDYKAADLKREQTPKMSLGFTYNLNQKSVKERGQMGSAIDDFSYAEDLTNIQADMMFKYKGFSIMGEFANRTVSDGSSPVLADTSGNTFGTYYTGSGLNLHMGYVLKNNWAVALRYTSITPEEETGNNDLTNYMVGISKYISGHMLKVQADFGIIQEDNRDSNIDNPDDQFQFRIQMDVAF
jgi:phosphate-selective porin OprO/OprP